MLVADRSPSFTHCWPVGFPGLVVTRAASLSVDATCGIDPRSEDKIVVLCLSVHRRSPLFALVAGLVTALMTAEL